MKRILGFLYLQGVFYGKKILKKYSMERRSTNGLLYAEYLPKTFIHRRLSKGLLLTEDETIVSTKGLLSVKYFIENGLL